MPKDKWLTNIVGQTGPIVATSANIAGEEYLHDLKHIGKKFLQSVDYISDQKTPKSSPSKIIDIVNKQILR